MNAKQICGVIVALCVASLAARADSLELKNGSLIKGKFMAGTQANITFQVGSSVQSYDVADIRSLRFDSEAQGASPSIPSKQPTAPLAMEKDEVATSSPSVTIPAGTRISVRTIDPIDSTRNHVGDRFQASLEEPLSVHGDVLVPKGADVYGRLEESKETGTFTGRSELELELTGNRRSWPDCAADHRRYYAQMWNLMQGAPPIRALRAPRPRLLLLPKLLAESWKRGRIFFGRETTWRNESGSGGDDQRPV